MGADQRPEAPVSPTPSQCSEFWDPPCVICKAVDDEANVLCELCNAAYHLACIERQKLKLPRAPSDEEWFCPRCVKKGVPEAIIDRVGRSHGAYYLVKWLGRPSSDVTWECAKTLDTAWCRRLIEAYVRHGPAGEHVPELEPCSAAELAAIQPFMAPALLLPPCHPLVDRLSQQPRTPAAAVAEELPRPAAKDDPDQPPKRGPGRPSKKHAAAEPPAAADATAGAGDSAAALGALCSGLEQDGPLGAVAREATALLQMIQDHPRRSEVAALLSPTGSAEPIAARALERAAQAIAHAREACARALGDAPAAGRAARTASYAGYLCYLREERSRIKEGQPGVSSRQVEKLAAGEWKSLPAERRADVCERAAGQLRLRLLEATNLNQMVPGLGKNGRHGVRVERKKQPCDCCGELDKFDAVSCSNCPARRHLMCFFPPWREEAPWRCDSCAALALSSGRRLPELGELLEAEVAEPPDKGGQIVWKRARVLRRKGASSFEVCINDETDFVELFDLEGEGKEWRRPAAAKEALVKAQAEAEAASVEAAKQQTLVARARQWDTEARRSPLLPQVEALYREGLCIVTEGITHEQVEAVREVVSEAFSRYMLAVRTLDLQEKLLAEGFMQIKMRNAGRYDLQLPELALDDFAFLMRDAPWMPLVHAALGSDAQLTHFGCMLSFPNSAVQPWHSDGPHIRSGGDPRFVAPLHAVNIFVPLVDLTNANGPTEFVPGSHVWHDLDEDPKAQTDVYKVRAGQAILFDYRLKHRGLSNTSSLERPLIYITYSRPFFLDVYNFDQKRYSELPPLEQRASRAERVQKRQRQ